MVGGKSMWKRYFHTSQWFFKAISNKKNRSASSHQWLTRHVNDPYVKSSRFDNYRARSAYKLIEIDDKYKLLKPGLKVVECGAAPGAWSQVISERINAAVEGCSQEKGILIAVDLLYIKPIDGIIIFSNSDFTSEETQIKIKSALKQNNIDKVDLVLSDMAINATGVSELDQENMMYIINSSLKFSLLNLKIGGNFLFKLWSGYNDKKIEENFIRFFNSFKRIKPMASRNESTEVFILCRDFKGVDTR